MLVKLAAAILIYRKHSSLFKRALIAVGLLAVAALFSASATPAQTIFNLTVDHCTGLCGPQVSFGTVKLTQDGASVDVSVELNNGNLFVNTGLYAMTFDIKSAKTGVTVSSLLPGWATFLTGSPLHQDGFGTFPYGIDCTGCGPGASTASANGNTLTFSVTATGGLTIADFISNGNVFFTADIISGTTGKTGAVGALGPSPTPEPASMLLFGTGILALVGMLGRRTSRDTVAT
jgi:hypothetical protein